jgi:hypothetical protein
MTLNNQIIGLAIALFIAYITGAAIVEQENELFNSIDSYCGNHTEAELYDSGKGIVNCTIVREGKMVAV